MLDKAYAEGLWFILCGQPGDGKTTAIRAFLRKHPGQKQPGSTQLPVLATRVPHGYSTANALMLAFAAEFGPVPYQKRGARIQQWLVDAAVDSGVRLIVVDDAHELTNAQLDWLREFLDRLAFHGVRPGLVLSAAILSDEPAKLPLWRRIDIAAMRASRQISDQTKLTAWQFSRRLHGTRPLKRIVGHNVREVGQILRAWERQYRPSWPSLNLVQWTTGLTDLCCDPRIDLARFGWVRIDPLAWIVRTALEEEAAAGGDGSGPELGERLRSAAIRYQTRGASFADVATDPLSGDVVFQDVEPESA